MSLMVFWASAVCRHGPVAVTNGVLCTWESLLWELVGTGMIPASLTSIWYVVSALHHAWMPLCTLIIDACHLQRPLLVKVQLPGAQFVQ